MGQKATKEKYSVEKEPSPAEVVESDSDQEDQATSVSSPTSPSPSGVRFAGGSSMILSSDDVSWLNFSVPISPKPTVWSALYLSRRDGKSFTKLIHSIKKIPHTIIVVKDADGYVFGMYCGDEWRDPADREQELKREAAKKARETRMGRKYESQQTSADTNFYGTGNCALVAIKPNRKLYQPTQKNDHYMYLHTSWPEASKNGIAMGGLSELLGVHLDQWLDHGYFKGANGICMTFNNPCLAGKPEFEIVEVEVWALGSSAVSGHTSKKPGIMQGKEAATDKFIFETAGKKFYSQTEDDQAKPLNLLSHFLLVWIFRVHFLTWHDNNACPAGCLRVVRVLQEVSKQLFIANT